MTEKKRISLVGKGRDAIKLVVDENSFCENTIEDFVQESDWGPGAVIGTANILGRKVTIIANDAKVRNPRFPVVAAGIIGLEEGFKMSTAVYKTIEADKDKSNNNKRPIILIVDTPGNSPGKIDEVFGMNKASGSYQLALTEARQNGHPVIAMIIGRAISGAILCHGLQADRILSLSSEYGTMIHVMPISSIARITKMNIEKLEELAVSNPVFASGASYFHKLGGVEEIIENSDDMTTVIDKHIKEIYKLNEKNQSELLGPWGRGILGAERGGRAVRAQVLELMAKQFAEIEEEFL